MITKWVRIRMLVFAGVLVLLGAGVARRAVQVQVRDSAMLRDLAQGNYLKEIELPPRRGRILDRNGDELASTVEFDSIFCNPRQLRHVPDAARQVARALDLDRGEVERILGQEKYFAWLRRKASREQSAAVQALKLPGIGVRKEGGRVYPGATLASTVIGHAGVDGRGLEGAELFYEKHLRGTGVQVVGVKDSYGRELLVDGMIDTSATAGQDLVLSLDKYLTFVTEQALARGVKAHNAKAGAVVVLDPRNGDVLAMASVPTYDPTARDSVARQARNRVVVDEYEPGSTMKTFAFAAALDLKKITPNQPFDCQMGRMTIGKHTIHDDHPKGVISATEVYRHSSNIGTVKVARTIGKQALYQALQRFGFGQRTGVGLPGERRGVLHNVKRWGEIEFATHSYGQGMTVSLMQLATGFAAIASGGVYRPPRLALKLVGPGGREEAVPPVKGAPTEQRAISEKTAATMLDIMLVSRESGTGKLAVVDGYPVAGKTGTPLKVVDGRYDRSKYMPSFVGIIPADRPRLVIAVMIDESQPLHYGGLVAAPVFHEIAEEAMRYLGVPPSVPIVAKKDKGKGKDKETGKEKPAAVVAEVAEGPGSDMPSALGLVAGDPDVEDVLAEAYGQEGEELGGGNGNGNGNGDGDGNGDGNGEVRGREMVMLPDFAGMSLGEAIAAAKRAGVELVPEGTGVAVSQWPRGGRLPRGALCRVSFRPRG